MNHSKTLASLLLRNFRTRSLLGIEYRQETGKPEVETGERLLLFVS